MWLWRAVDDEGEVLDMLVQKRRNTTAALRLLRKLLKHQGILPEVIVMDGLPRIAPRPENSAAAIVTDEAACVQITGPRIHIWSYDEGNASSRNSSPRVQPRDSSMPTPPSKTHSIFNVT
jgi:hypothetical protein